MSHRLDGDVQGEREREPDPARPAKPEQRAERNLDQCDDWPRDGAPCGRPEQRVGDRAAQLALLVEEPEVAAVHPVAAQLAEPRPEIDRRDEGQTRIRLVRGDLGCSGRTDSTAAQSVVASTAIPRNRRCCVKVNANTSWRSTT